MNTIPPVGTKEFERWAENARRNPDSIEGKILQQIMQKAVEDHHKQVRQQLQLMIELVPGQMFRDVSLFHEKFGLSPTDDPDHVLPGDLLRFRIKFMMEELQEYCEAVCLTDIDGELSEMAGLFNAEKALDALIDLCYVALGTAYLHRFSRFNEAWSRVQEANMSKVRADGADDSRSHRKHSADIVKPEGWKAPVLTDLLETVCVNCKNDVVPLPGPQEEVCQFCKGTRRVPRSVQSNDHIPTR